MGTGANFDQYPANCRLTALDSNENFKTEFMRNVENYPNIEFKEYVNQSVEEMTQIADNSMDAVLITHVFCSVPDVQRALSEVKRVLKKVFTRFFQMVWSIFSIFRMASTFSWNTWHINKIIPPKTSGQMLNTSWSQSGR